MIVGVSTLDQTGSHRSFCADQYLGQTCLPQICQTQMVSNRSGLIMDRFSRDALSFDDIFMDHFDECQTSGCGIEDRDAGSKPLSVSADRRISMSISE